MNDALIDRLLTRASRCTQRSRTLARNHDETGARAFLRRAKTLLELAAQARLASAVSQLSESNSVT